MTVRIPQTCMQGEVTRDLGPADNLATGLDMIEWIIPGLLEVPAFASRPSWRSRCRRSWTG
jgi:hypothetical protein